MDGMGPYCNWRPWHKGRFDREMLEIWHDALTDRRDFKRIYSYPRLNKLVDPENNNFLMKTNLPTPMTGRVYVNLLQEGIISDLVSSRQWHNGRNTANSQRAFYRCPFPTGFMNRGVNGISNQEVMIDGVHQTNPAIFSPSLTWVIKCPHWTSPNH